MSQETEYAKCQAAWLSNSGLKCGSYASCAQKVDDFQSGWGGCWLEAMDRLVGETGEIVGIGPGNYGIQLRFEGHPYDEWFPFFALIIVK
jgi:hypothetical protein